MEPDPTGTNPLDAVLTNLPFGLLTLDRTGRVTALNPPARALGNEVGEFPVSARGDRSDLAGELVSGILQQGEPTFLRTQLPDGTLSLTIAFPVDDDTVAFLGFTGHDELARQLDLAREDEISRLRDLVRDLGGDPDAA